MFCYQCDTYHGSLKEYWCFVCNKHCYRSSVDGRCSSHINLIKRCDLRNCNKWLTNDDETCLKHCDYKYCCGEYKHKKKVCTNHTSINILKNELNNDLPNNLKDVVGIIIDHIKTPNNLY